MKAKVMFFTPFRELFGVKEREIELSGTPDVRGLLELLCDSDERREKIFGQSGELRPYVMIFKNGQPIQMSGGIQTELKDGDEIAIFPPVSGG
ncbi:MAG: MoaD/ThiS family protein [Anaerolineales bacterium]|nr:MoaD/ThiS family protein [Anaerolineales bacterium]